MRLLALLFALVLSTAGTTSSRAQTAPNPETVREAHAMMARFDMAGLMRQQIAQSQERMGEMIRSANLDKDAEDLLTKYATELQEKSQESVPKYIEEATLVYARHFTLEELKQINTFYDSPVGQKLIAKTPEIAGELSDLSTEAVGSVTQKMLGQLKAELEKRRTPQAPK
jgi:hypothetical protein